MTSPCTTKKQEHADVIIRETGSPGACRLLSIRLFSYWTATFKCIRFILKPHQIVRLRDIRKVPNKFIELVTRLAFKNNINDMSVFIRLYFVKLGVWLSVE